METIKNVVMENFSVNELRQRLFVKKATKIYPNREYTYLDDVPEQIEKLNGFTKWETYGEEWDILWVGLDPRTLKWVNGRHNSPVRKIVAPVRIVLLDDRTKRMQVSFEVKEDIDKLEVPFKEPLPETDEDRIISNSLSGKVVIDETDENKAKRALKQNIDELSAQLAKLNAMAAKFNI